MQLMISKPASFIQIIVLLSIGSVPAVVHAQFPYTSCSSDGVDSPANSSYLSSLDSLLSSIATVPLSMLSNGFLNLSTNQPDYVEVLGLCHADLTADACRSCLGNSGAQIKHQCPSEKQAVLFNENCTMMYSNTSIYGTVATSPHFSLYNPINASNSTKHVQEVRKLLDSLRAQAAQGGLLRKYATGFVSVDSVPIYGMVQCTPDLSNQQCSDCLATITGLLLQCCVGKIGARLFSPSCQLRFETNFLFFGLIPSPIFPPPPATLPSSPPTTAPLTPTTSTLVLQMWQRPLGSNSAKTWIIIVASSTSMVLNAIILIFLIAGKKTRAGRQHDQRVANGVRSAESF